MAISKVIYKSSASAQGVTWIDATPATAAAADIISPKTAMLADGVVTQGTGSATFVVTVSYNDSTENWEPTCTFSQIADAYAAGKTILVCTDSSDAAADGWYGYESPGDEWLEYLVEESYTDAGVSKIYFQRFVYNENELRRLETAAYLYPDGTYTVSASGTFNIAKYASVSVPAGTAGTPTATKGTVSNHSVTITPSVTNTTGYITGSTKTGTSVSVSASELVSGTYTVDSSGTKDVTNYASASVPAGTAGTPSATKGTVSNHSVSVTPSVTNQTGWITGSTKTGTAVTVTAAELVSGSETKTENGTYDVTNLASLVVNVSGGSSDVATGTLTVASNVNTSTNTAIATTSTIGFTPTKFFFWKDSRTATNNHVHQATFTSLGSYYIRTMTRYSSNALSTSGNTNNWTTQTAGYLYFNSNTVYFRSSSSYILSAGTWHWVAVK